LFCWIKIYFIGFGSTYSWYRINGVSEKPFLSDGLIWAKEKVGDQRNTMAKIVFA
jgi:hypothetical protein